jgi:hypothetical protein
MKSFLVIILGFYLFVPSYLLAQKAKPTPKVTSKAKTETAITQDGKKVLLKSDGTWEYISKSQGKNAEAAISSTNNTVSEFKFPAKPFLINELITSCVYQTEKDSFETYAQYLQRLEDKLGSQKTKSGFECKDFYISLSFKDFVESPKSAYYISDSKTYYNPETEELKIPKELIDGQIHLKYDQNSKILVGDRDLGRNYYTGNTVIIGSGDDYGIYRDGVNSIKIVSPTGNYITNYKPLAISLKSSEARESFSHLKLVFIVVPLRVLENPNNGYFEGYKAIVVAKRRFYLLNELTGKILLSGDFPIRK